MLEIGILLLMFLLAKMKYSLQIHICFFKSTSLLQNLEKISWIDLLTLVATYLNLTSASISVKICFSVKNLITVLLSIF